jgi:hypothetical protein
LREYSYAAIPPPSRAKNTANPPTKGPAETFEEDGLVSLSGKAEFKMTVSVGGADGASVGLEVGPEVGPDVGPEVGPAVGPEVGPDVGPEVGPAVGPDVGPEVGLAVGPDVGTELGAREGVSEGILLGINVGVLDGFAVGALVGFAVGALVTRMLFFALLILAEELFLELLMLLAAGILKRGSSLSCLFDLAVPLAFLEAFLDNLRIAVDPSLACWARVGSIEADEVAVREERVTKVKKRARFFLVKVIMVLGCKRRMEVDYVDSE